MKFFSIISICILLSSCTLEMAYEEQAEVEMIESIVTSISGLIDDEGGISAVAKPLGSSTAKSTKTRQCPRTKAKKCIQLSRKLSFNKCGSDSTKKTGTVSITYSNTSCDSSISDSIATRTYDDVQFSGVRENNLQISSDAQSNYKNQSISGGSTIKNNNDDSFNISIKGISKKLVSESKRELTNHSLQSLEDGVFYNRILRGSFARSGRTLEGGSFVVDNNINKFTMLFQPRELLWANTCCHPVGGSAEIEFSGSRDDKARVIFGPSCGELSYRQEDHADKALKLSYCE